MNDFKSPIVKRLLGNGISKIEEVSRSEAKYVLSSIEAEVKKENWLPMVVNGYMGGCSWDDEHLITLLTQIKEDLRLLKQRLVDTACEQPKESK